MSNLNSKNYFPLFNWGHSICIKNRNETATMSTLFDSMANMATMSALFDSMANSYDRAELYETY